MARTTITAISFVLATIKIKSRKIGIFFGIARNENRMMKGEKSGVRSRV